MSSMDDADSDISRYPMFNESPVKKRKAIDDIDSSEVLFKRARMNSPGGCDPTFSPSQFFFSPRTFDVSSLPSPHLPHLPSQFAVLFPR